MKLTLVLLFLVVIASNHGARSSSLETNHPQLVNQSNGSSLNETHVSDDPSKHSPSKGIKINQNNTKTSVKGPNSQGQAKSEKNAKTRSRGRKRPRNVNKLINRGRRRPIARNKTDEHEIKPSSNEDTSLTVDKQIQRRFLRNRERFLTKENGQPIRPRRFQSNLIGIPRGIRERNLNIGRQGTMRNRYLKTRKTALDTPIGQNIQGQQSQNAPVNNNDYYQGKNGRNRLLPFRYRSYQERYYALLDEMRAREDEDKNPTKCINMNSN